MFFAFWADLQCIIFYKCFFVTMNTSIVMVNTHIVMLNAHTVTLNVCEGSRGAIGMMVIHYFVQTERFFGLRLRMTEMVSS